MKRILLLIGAVLVLVVAATGCEPKMTVTAKPVPAAPACDDNQASIIGKVTPPTAAKYVVLQKTFGGRWVDWQWYPSAVGGNPHTLTATVTSDGTYTLYYSPTGTVETAHLRVRSSAASGSVLSPAFYVTFKHSADTPDC